MEDVYLQSNRTEAGICKSRLRARYCTSRGCDSRASIDGTDLAMRKTDEKPGRVAIDGPSASGKSTVGRLLALRWGYRFLDTGMMYRCVTEFAIRRKVDLSDGTDLGELASSIDFRLRHSERGMSDLIICGLPVADQLYSDEVTASVSRVSAVADVRVALVAKQREIGTEGEIVMAGRDIGTVVMPDAPLKVYLEASASTRARRRANELQARGAAVSYEEILASIERRDEYDSSRAHSPLMRAEDALQIDTDTLSVVEVVESIVETYAGTQSAGWRGK